MTPTTTTTRKLHLLLGGKPTEREVVQSPTTRAQALSVDPTRVAPGHASRQQASNEPARALRATHARMLASKTRALMYEIEEVIDLDASKLRAYALHLENMAERWTSQAS